MGFIVLTIVYGTRGICKAASIGGIPRRIILPWFAVNSTPCWINGTAPDASTLIVVPTPPVIPLISSTRVPLISLVFTP